MIFLFPLYWAFSTSLRNPLDTFTVAGLGIPWVNFEPTLDNWIDQLGDRRNPGARWPTATVIAVGASLLALLLGTPAAYALARFRFRRMPEPRHHGLVPLAARPAAGRDRDSVLSRDARRWACSTPTIALILINATFVLPFVVVIMRQTFLDLPVELEEAALVDGAGHFGAFWRIALPLAAPAIAATGLIIFAFAWNEFLFAIAISSKQAITDPGAHGRRRRLPRRAVLVHGGARDDRDDPAGADRAARPALHRARPDARARSRG